MKVLEECLRCGAIKGTTKHDNGESSPPAASKKSAVLRAASQASSPNLEVSPVIV